MQLNPYLSFDGQCSEAFEFYQKLLGGDIALTQTYGQTPMADQIPAEARDRIAHTRLIAGDVVLMGSDVFPAAAEGCGRYEKPQGMDVTLGLDDVAEARRLFDALAEGGSVRMAFDKTFFAEGFGMVTDRFGTPWMVICERAT